MTRLPRESDFLHRNALELPGTARSLLCVHGSSLCMHAVYDHVVAIPEE